MNYAIGSGFLSPESFGDPGLRQSLHNLSISICGGLDGGESPAAILQTIGGPDSDATPQQDAALLAGAIAGLCPWHAS